MSNNFTKLKDPELLGLLNTLVTNLDGQTTAYGITSADYTNLETNAGIFNTAVQEWDIADAARKAATQNKSTRKTSTVTFISNLAKKIYANTAVTDQMLANIGLAPRPVNGGRTTPKTPTDFVASTEVNGDVKFSWKRNGNSMSAVFNLQQWSGTEWVTIAAVPRTRITLSGFPIGEAQTFRVFAWLNNLQSAPSNAFTIYNNPSQSLEVAA